MEPVGEGAGKPVEPSGLDSLLEQQDYQLDPAYQPAQSSAKPGSKAAVVIPPPAKPYQPRYQVAYRPLNVAGVMEPPGTPVPHAEDWPRVETWVRARRLELIPGR